MRESSPTTESVLDPAQVSVEELKEMLSKSHPNLPEEVREFIGKFWEWGADHRASEAHRTTGLLPYDPTKYQGQQPDKPYVLQHEPWYFKIAPVYKHIVLPRARKQLGEGMGSEDLVDEMIEDFRSQTVPFAGDAPLLDFLKTVTRRGEQTMIIVPHDDQGDVARVGGMLKVSYADRELAQSFVLFMSFLMAFEEHDGTPVTETLIRFFDEIMLTPDTENAKKYALAREMKDMVNRGGLGKFAELRRESGRIAIQAPFASGVKHVPLLEPRHGAVNLPRRLPHIPFRHQETSPGHEPAPSNAPTEKMVFPKLPLSAAKLVRRAKYVMPVSMYRDPATEDMSWRIDPLVEVEALTVGARDRNEEVDTIAHYIRTILRDSLASLTNGIPVELDPSEPELAGPIARRLYARRHLLRRRDSDYDSFDQL